MTSAAELRELEDEELETRLAEYRRELLNLRFQLATGQLDNQARLSEVKKDVARALTVLRDREIAEAEGRPAGPVPAVPAPRPRRARAAAPVAEEPEDEELADEELEDEAVAEDDLEEEAVAEDEDDDEEDE
jgi:large subunit ribosomal protein L29